MESARNYSLIMVGAGLFLVSGTPALGAGEAVDTITISPDPAVVGDTLTCTWNFTDDEGDPDASTLEWTVDGVVVGTSTTLSGGFAGGETVTCTVTASDGTDIGNQDSSSITISNTAPEVTAHLMSPSTIYTDDIVTVSVTTTDADGDAVTLDYDWYVNEVLQIETSGSLDGATFFGVGDTVRVDVTPSDGSDDGAVYSVSAVTVANSLPVLDAATLSPDPAYEDDTLSCVAGTSTDDDGDTVTFTYAWTVDGGRWMVDDGRWMVDDG